MSSLAWSGILMTRRFSSFVGKTPNHLRIFHFLTKVPGKDRVANKLYRCFSSDNSSLTFASTHLQNTVYALSSGHGKCGVAVIRITGPQAGEALKSLGNFEKLPAPRSAVLRKLRNPKTQVVLDKGLVLWFPAPASFTGEDSCELQVHGGLAVVTSVFAALESIPGLQPAEPGDFTRRSFANGKLDLPEVEGLADLIHAETEAQRQQALRQMDGDLSKMYSTWRASLIRAAAKLAAYTDFSEDELIEDNVLTEVKDIVEELKNEIRRHLYDKRCGERLRDGVRLAIIGEPNVGKSSIFNILSQRPAAIVSPIAGTTRDVVENALDIGGYPVVVCDTAGMHDTENPVEQEGVRRARNRARNADLQLFVIDGTKIVSDSKLVAGMRNALPLCEYLSSISHINEDNYENQTPESGQACSQDSEILIENPAARYASDVLVYCNTDSSNRWKAKSHPFSETNEDLSGPIDNKVLVIVNKSDLINTKQSGEGLSLYSDWCFLSCLTGEGVDEFLELLTAKLKLLCGNPSTGAPNLTQARHRACLVRCHQALLAYTDHHDTDCVLAGEQLRRAIYHMGKLTGKISSEDILDVVFKDFCIGK